MRCLLLLCCVALVWGAGLAAGPGRPARDPFLRAADHAADSVGPATPLNWGEGVLTYGLFEAWRVTRSPRYLEAVQAWADHHCAKSLLPLLRKRGYCGHWGPGTPLVLLHEHTPQPRYLEAATEIRNFVRDSATRTAEGALGHYRGSVQIWVDTLCMVCPTFARYSVAAKDPTALEDAVKQLDLAARHLQDPKTGLFWHMWDERTGKHSQGFWGRGNGWVIISLADVLEVLPKTHRSYAELQKVLQAQVRGLIAHEAPSGMWRTVVERADAYEETSATAMITYGIAKAMQLKLIAEDHTPRLLRAWAALEKQVDADGVVLGTSAGTGPRGIAHYLARPRGEYTWGTGAFLLAGAKLRQMGIASPQRRKR